MGNVGLSEYGSIRVLSPLAVLCSFNDQRVDRCYGLGSFHHPF